MTHYLLFYDVADDYLERRAAFRDQHLEKAWAASARGALVLGGALGDPVDAALLLFLGDSPAVAEEFARVDPYVTNGLVKRWYVRQWNTVAGAGAANPIRASAKDGPPR
jgi:uncharacterized protein YciI